MKFWNYSPLSTTFYHKMEKNEILWAKPPKKGIKKPQSKTGAFVEFLEIERFWSKISAHYQKVQNGGALWEAWFSQ